MNGREFIKMMRSENEGENDREQKLLHKEIINIMESIVNQNSDCEIDNNKTTKECYDKMQEKAKKEQKGGCYCFTNEGAMEFIAEYLGIKNVSNATQPKERKHISLEDFL